MKDFGLPHRPDTFNRFSDHGIYDLHGMGDPGGGTTLGIISWHTEEL